MCGIAGIILKRPVDEKLLDTITDTLAHRGPDGRGTWLNNDRTVGLGQRRLAIIDLSEGGKQPRVSEDGLVSVVFNGEIYNYQDIKSELKSKGKVFVSESDTEVLLAAYLEWGKECLSRLDGMFAFAIWDGRTNELFAARDRAGERPFKYYFTSDKFLFASEIKALFADPAVPREVDWQAVDVAFSFRYVPAPLTGFKHIHKLPAGHYLIWRGGEVKTAPYWDAYANRPKEPDYSTENLWRLFLDSVRHRMISDRPLGAFLSGGLDSTSVVAAMAEIFKDPIETFAVSLGERSPDMDFAKIAADHFKTNHHEISLADVDLGRTVETLAAQYDEPFFDQSALPSLVINQAVKKYVTVVLSGDGGDEVFGGYDAYPFSRFLQRYSRIPGAVKNSFGLISAVSAKRRYQVEVLNQEFFASYSDYFSLWKSALPKSNYYVTKTDLYRPEFAANLDMRGSGEYMKQWFGKDLSDIANAAMLADIRGRLPDGYLAKVDFASLRNAVEVRPPFLDPRLLELSQAIPSSRKIVGKNGKVIWKEVVKNKIPSGILNRPKAGFGVPLQHLLFNELKEITESSLLSSESRINQYFNKDAVVRLFDDHRAGRADYSNHIWSLLVLELWLRQYIAR